MLKRKNTVLLILDIQGKLAEIVFESEKVLKNSCMLIDGFRTLGLPIIWLEQYPEGLGHTLHVVSSHLDGYKPIFKREFSAAKNPTVLNALKETGRKQIVVIGIETHVCVYQTSSELITLGYELHVVKDAISSRTEFNKNIGLNLIERAGGFVTSVETVLMELIETSESEDFKKILKIIK